MDSTDNCGQHLAGASPAPPKAPVGEAPVLSFLPPARPGMGFIRELSWVMGRFVRLGRGQRLEPESIMRILSYCAAQFFGLATRRWVKRLAGCLRMEHWRRMIMLTCA